MGEALHTGTAVLSIVAFVGTIGALGYGFYSGDYVPAGYSLLATVSLAGAHIALSKV